MPIPWLLVIWLSPTSYVDQDRPHDLIHDLIYGENMTIPSQQASALPRLPTSLEASSSPTATPAAAPVKASVDEAERAKSFADAKAKADEEARARSLDDAKAKADEEARARSLVDANAKADEEARAKLLADDKAKADEEARARSLAEAKAKALADAAAKARASADAAKAEAAAKAKAKAAEQARLTRKARHGTQNAARAPAFWPKYVDSHSATLLDGQWSYGLHHGVEPASPKLDLSSSTWTPNTTSVPSCIDPEPPGFLGPRATAVYRTTFQQTSKHARLWFGACSFYCRVWVDDVEIGDHRAGGYVAFYLDLPPISGASATRSLTVLADNRFHKKTAPMHTSWLKMPSALSDDTAPSAFLGHLEAQATPTHLR